MHICYRQDGHDVRLLLLDVSQVAVEAAMMRCGRLCWLLALGRPVATVNIMDGSCFHNWVGISGHRVFHLDGAAMVKGWRPTNTLGWMMLGVQLWWLRFEVSNIAATVLDLVDLKEDWKRNGVNLASIGGDMRWCRHGYIVDVSRENQWRLAAEKSVTTIPSTRIPRHDVTILNSYP